MNENIVLVSNSRKNYNVSKILAKILIYIVLIAGAALMVFPYVWMFLTSFKSPIEAMSLRLTLFPEKWITENYSIVTAEIPFFTGIWNTVKVEVSVIVVGTFVSSMAAFSFAKLKLRHKDFWLLFLMSGMMVPYAALMMPQFRAFMALNMFDTLWPLILPGFFGNISMMFFLIQYMKGISNAYFEAAKIDGAGYMRMLHISVLEKYNNRIFNIHPALLPKFGGKGMHGMNVHTAVIKAKESETGVTIHRVNAEYDSGEIVAQTTVPVLKNDTPEILAARVLDREHEFWVEVIADIVNGEITLG